MAGDGARGDASRQEIVAAILILIVVVFALANSRTLNVDFVFADVTLPLFVVIVGSAIIGPIVGWFLGRRRED